MGQSRENEGAEFWVFGYGSLIWRPGFPYIDRRRATLPGHRRWFCMRSIEHRGAPDRPGLVLGLDPDPEASAMGVAYRVDPAREAEVRAYLWDREMGTYGYHEVEPVVDIEDHGPRPALTYVIDRDHPQYARLSLADQVDAIVGAVGISGPNPEYVRQTAEGLRSLDITDPDIETLDRLVQARLASQTAEEIS